MKNKVIVIALMIFLIISLSGCIKVEKPIEKVSKPVEIESIENKTHTFYRSYNGLIESKKMTNLAFKYGGKVKSVDVAVGDIISPGDKIASLGKKDIEKALSSANKDYSLAVSSYKKAQKTYNYLLDKEKDLQVLYEKGAIASDELDKVELEREIAWRDLQSAQRNIEKAEINIELNKDKKKDFTLYSKNSGRVLDVLVEEDEIVKGGYPVVVLQDQALSVTFGLTQGDYNEISVGDSLRVEYETEKYSARVIKKETVPDSESRTYEVEALLETDQLPLKSIVSVSFEYGQVRGARVPIGSVISGEKNYVYVVEDNKAVKKEIEIVKIIHEYVIVKKLDDSDKVVTKGMKALKPNQNVKVLER